MPPKSMEKIMALCKRRGFIYQASDLYGGLNGFWDYGPLGAQLKKNLRDRWWHDVVMDPCNGALGPDGQPVEVVGLETCIIQHPRVWVASGHTETFSDPMVDCRETKARYRFDHVSVYVPAGDTGGNAPRFAFVAGTPSETRQRKKADKAFGAVAVVPLAQLPAEAWSRVIAPDADTPGTLTEPRAFNLMFKTYVGATATEDDVAYLRPETAQGIFVQFKNVVDSTRVKVPFGIAQTGKAFRNEVTPRNFTFRSREFEQMEIEFFCHPNSAPAWYAFWRDARLAWWKAIGLAGDNLCLREQSRDELAHYARDGAGTSDIEYRFPFTDPEFGELEGVAHRADFDLATHQKHARAKLEYFDTERGELLPGGGRKGERYLPHVIEPSAGLDRGVLALLCEAFTEDASRPSPELLRLHPRLAPIKAAVFPLVNKDGMPEISARLHAELARRFRGLGFLEHDVRGTIGKRYARMDEAGCPYCFTVDGQTVQDRTVTARDRDTGHQERIALDRVGDYLAERLERG
ncbi:MAG TPA: glycine--tRNA ligase [Kofleriaceae bacterium]|jgi:glycyl-tRNA synthetase|nr:glycine--tRNA ligase [Kofleriaceae bacterium]